MIFGLSTETMAIITGAGVSATVAATSLIKWLGSAKLRETITETVKTSIPEIYKISDLTVAVTRLTDALGTQSLETKDLNATIKGVDERVQQIGLDMVKLGERTTNLENAFPSVKTTADAAAKVVESAARAAEAVLQTATMLAASKTPKKKTAKRR